MVVLLNRARQTHVNNTQEFTHEFTHVHPVDVCKPIPSVNSNKNVRTLNSNKPVNSKIVHPVDTRKPNHILTNPSENVSQNGVIDLGISDHQLIYCTRKIRRIKHNMHNQIQVRSLKNYSAEI